MPGIHRNHLVFKSLAALLGLVALVGCLAVPAAARTRKGDKFLAQGKDREAHKDWDGALDFYNKALNEDPADPGYQLEVHQARFQASQAHVSQGLKLRKDGSLAPALLEFQKAYGLDPSSSVAEQEIKTTVQMIEREKKKGADSDTRGLTPSQLAKRNSEEKLDSMLSVPELRPLNAQPINLKMNGQPTKILFETVGKLAGINVLFDSEFKETNKQSIELTGATLYQALDYLAIVSKAFWKPLSGNTIFVTQDNTTKRRDYEEQVMKVFYLTNVTTPQELQEIVTAVRSVADIQRLFVYNAQNAIIARGEADRIALAEKIIHDLDKPKSEVVVDVLVFQVSSDMTRTLGAALSSLSIPVNFAPRSTISTPSSSTSTTASTSTPTTNTTGTTATTGSTTTSTSASVPLALLSKVGTNDFSTVLPSGMLQAVLSDSGTRVLQSPQLRSVDNQKATLKIGEKEPIASGSFQPGVGGVGINPLVNTQFTFIDVGVNVDLTPKVHDNGEISMHIEVEISSVQSYVNLGGISQPIIAQEKVIHDIRMKDGEVNLLGGLKQSSDSTTLTGIPGLSSIPVIKWLFSSKQVSKSSQELVIALIPHIVRRPDYTEEEMRGIAVGNATVVKLNYAHPPQADGEPAPKSATPPAPGAPAAPLATPPASANPPAAAPVTVPQVNAPPSATTSTPGAPPSAPAPPQANASVNFVPAQVETIMGGSFSVNLVMANATDLFSAPLQIKFDPKVLKLNDVAQGNLMASDGQQATFTKNIQNDTGEADITLNRLPGTGGITGSGMLVTLSFTTLARGATSVSAPAFSPSNSQGQPISNSSPLLTVNVR
ncbi:MAG: cohesin domain-containing protein [Bryobacteraceae bacterium]|jgi:general secretion pathway protein D